MECREIRISLRPSRRFACVLFALYLLAIVALGCSGLPARVVGPVVGVLLFDLLRQAWLRLWKTDRCSCVIRFGGDWLYERDGVLRAVAPDRATAMLGPLVVLILSSGRQRHVHVLTRDAFTVHEWRRLRVLLRYSGDPRQPGVRIVSSASGARSG